MRTGNATTEEILQAEQAVDERKRSRANGYTLMKDRDRNWGRLTPYFSSAAEVYMKWGFDESTKFLLEIRPYGGGKTIQLILDAEEVRKYLRWV